MIMKRIFRNSLIFIFIFVFIILYFQILIQTYIIPNNYEISIVLLLGFVIIIIGIFYFFLKIDFYNKIVASVKILNENLTKTILIILMTITIFIPSVSFSDVIIVWNEIPPLNYVRGCVFLIGALFIPGACIFNLILPKSTIHERLNVKPFLVKITIYPIISLTFLGSITLILDFLGLPRLSFIPFLFFSIIFLYLLDVFFQKLNVYELKNKITEIKISRYTFLILFIGLGITIIALGIQLSSNYLIAGDRWRSISSGTSIGLLDTSPFDSPPYVKYWGFVSFSLSNLCGLPYINTNALLFPFLYLSITSIYLLTKALLNNMNEMFSVLSSIFIVIFSQLFITISLNQLIRGLHYRLLFHQFTYHSYAYFSLFVSLTLFFIVIRSNNKEHRSKLTTENIVLLALSSLFLIQSLLSYYIPSLVGILIIFLYCPFSKNIQKYLRHFLIFYFFFIIFFIAFDLMAFNFFGYYILNFLSYFSGISLHFPQVELRSLRFLLISLVVYSFLISFFILLFLIYKFSSRWSIIIEKIKLHKNFILKKKFKYFFIFMICFFSICLLIGLSNVSSSFKGEPLASKSPNDSFLTFYLSTLIVHLGFFGILGIYLSYFCFKENKNLFFFLLCWIVLIIGLASSFIFLRWIQNPTSLISEISEDDFTSMMYFFTRNWFFSTIPLSIFTSIGLIKLISKMKSRSWFNFKTNKGIRSIQSLFLVSILIYSSLSNTIITAMYWNNHYSVSNEEAQIIGWTSKNVPINSTILNYPYNYNLRRMHNNLYLFTYYFLDNNLNLFNEAGELIYNFDSVDGLIYNLNSKNIYYLIIIRYYISEKYQELIDQFYNTTLFQYGNYIIYKSNEF